MKAGVIHDDYAFGFEAWNQCVFVPVIKYITIDVLLKVTPSKQHLFVQSTNDVGSIFGLPIIAIDARGPNRCITMRANGLGLKATLIHVYNSKALSDVVAQFT